MGGQDTVCLLEEDPAIQRLIVLILEQDGITATVCPSGEELLAAVGSTAPALALVDVGIPAEPAINLIGQIRTQSIPVLATDATGENSIAHACVQVGADDHQPKPFDPETLLDRVAFLLGRPQPAEQESAVFGGGSIRLDLLNRTLTVQGHRVPISRTEWDILRTLALNAREPVFHGDLARSAFDPELRRDAEYLKLWVTRLQTKIGQDPANQRLLRPFHDVAYVLAVDALPGE